MRTQWIVVVGVVVAVSISVFVLVVAVGFRKVKTVRNGKLAACASFEGGQMGAVWTECPDKVRREVRCEHFVRDLTCHCYEDGAEKWFFNAKDPPLSTRDEATRVANANCHWPLELP